MRNQAKKINQRRRGPSVPWQVTMGRTESPRDIIAKRKAKAAFEERKELEKKGHILVNPKA